jgi:DNA-binding CsgD family transcriptional regulator
MTATWPVRALDGIRIPQSLRGELTGTRAIRMLRIAAPPAVLAVPAAHSLVYNHAPVSQWVLVVATIGLLLLRDRLPVLVAAGCLIGAAALVLADLDNPGALAAVVALFTVVVRARWGAALGITLVALSAGGAAAVRFGRIGSIDDAVAGMVALVVGTVAAGIAVRVQRRRLATAEEDARRLRAEASTPVAPLDPADPGHPLATLTPRERDVFERIVEGLSNAEIARALYVSETTVKSHVTHVLAKLRLRDRVQVVIFAHDRGLAARTAVREDSPG